MSTRSTTHFLTSRYGTYNNTAIIYRHDNGYPEGAGCDLISFLKQCKALPDSRLSDPPYLAAKYVVFLADMYNSSWELDEVTRERKQIRHESKLDFLSVGILPEDPGDIEYRYTVDCGKIGKNGLPEVKCFEVNEDENGKVQPTKEVKIPRGKNNWL